MKRFYIIAVAAALATCVGNNPWSHGGQAGGGGAAGGAAGAGSSGTAGTSGTAGAAGAAGTAGTAGTPGTAGAPGANRAGVGANANAQFNSNFNGISRTPFFADPGVRSQLQMNNRQFNQLNAAYLRALERYNRGLNSPAARIQNRRAAAANSGTANVATGTATNVDGTPTASTSGAATATTNDGPAAAPRTITNSPAPTSIEEQQRLARLQQLQDQFRNDFNTSLDATFTDPAMRQRFNQLNLQSQGLGAFNDPAIQQQLNLSAQQRQQLAALNAQWRRDLMNLQRGNRNNLTQAEFDALRAQYAARLNAILTVQQQQSWGQLVGQPFNFPFTIFLPPTEPVVDRRGDSPTTNQAPAPSSATRSPQTQTVR